jgi:DNA-binding CsgD family transcriptional regulator
VPFALSGMFQKPFCSQLCPEAEAYANQNRVARREFFTLPEPRYKTFPDQPADHSNLSKTQWKIVMLLKKKFTRKEVCVILNISRHNFRSQFSKIKAKNDGSFAFSG